MDYKKTSLSINGMNVLIVDDSAENCHLLKNVLEFNGLQISVSLSGKTALEIISKSAPDLIILDIMMPEMSGFEVCNILKETPETENIPIIFISGRTLPEEISKGFEMGCVDFITKPFQMSEVTARVETHLRMQKYMAEKEEMILHLQSLNTKLERASRTDPMTGLANRRAMFEKLLEEQSRFIRYQRPFSLIISDIDHFKKVNDTWGHLAGDRVLVRVGEIMTENFRNIDTVARWGGEEFLILLPETHVAAARSVAEKIRHQVENEAFDIDGQTINVTLSSGVIESTEPDLKDDRLLKKVDELLYRAKEAGRNQVVS